MEQKTANELCLALNSTPVNTQSVPTAGKIELEFEAGHFALEYRDSGVDVHMSATGDATAWAAYLCASAAMLALLSRIVRSEEEAIQFEQSGLISKAQLGPLLDLLKNRVVLSSTFNDQLYKG